MILPAIDEKDRRRQELIELLGARDTFNYRQTIRILDVSYRQLMRLLEKQKLRKIEGELGPTVDTSSIRAWLESGQPRNFFDK